MAIVVVGCTLGTSKVVLYSLLHGSTLGPLLSPRANRYYFTREPGLKLDVNVSAKRDVVRYIVLPQLTAYFRCLKMSSGNWMSAQ